MDQTKSAPRPGLNRQRLADIFNCLILYEKLIVQLTTRRTPREQNPATTRWRSVNQCSHSTVKKILDPDPHPLVKHIHNWLMSLPPLSHHKIPLDHSQFTRKDWHYSQIQWHSLQKALMTNKLFAYFYQLTHKRKILSVIENFTYLTFSLINWDLPYVISSRKTQPLPAAISSECGRCVAFCSLTPGN